MLRRQAAEDEASSDEEEDDEMPADFLAINNSYEFFDQAGGLLKTGPTHTNVMDLRVAVVGS